MYSSSNNNAENTKHIIGTKNVLKRTNHMTANNKNAGINPVTLYMKERI